jgi:hypothetical protein
LVINFHWLNQSDIFEPKKTNKKIQKIFQMSTDKNHQKEDIIQKETCIQIFFKISKQKELKSKSNFSTQM